MPSRPRPHATRLPVLAQGCKPGPVTAGNVRSRGPAPIMARGYRCHQTGPGRSTPRCGKRSRGWTRPPGTNGTRDPSWSGEPGRIASSPRNWPGWNPAWALRLGTGEGRNAIWLAERGWQVTGVDFSATGLARAAELARQRGVSVDWVQDDLLGYEPAPAGYDLVLIAYIQLPADELTRLVRAAVTALAPGGTLLAVGHDPGQPGGGLRRPAVSARALDAVSVAAELDGLTVERAEQVQRHVQTADGERVAIDTLVLGLLLLALPERAGTDAPNAAYPGHRPPRAPVLTPRPVIGKGDIHPD